MEKIEVLKVKIDNLDKKSALEKLDYFLRGDSFNQIVTINPEFVLEAQKNRRFRDILNNAELGLVDGVGINLAFWRNGMRLKSRMTGMNLIWNVLEKANEERLKVFLIASKDGISDWRTTRQAIRERYPFLKICGMNLNPNVTNANGLRNISKLQGSDILFCNFGAPHQEIFINSVRDCEAKIKLAVGVGGSFDFISGKIRRAPKFVRILGLEWLWRLFVQPWRIKRIFRAVVIFPIKVLVRK
ncbi:WecB/TagA/CpsF family glycosyltransferase [Patescibacteria group bacterium]